MALHTEGFKAFGDFYGPFQNELIAAATGIEKGGVANLSLNVSQMTRKNATTWTSCACSCHARQLTYDRINVCMSICVAR